MELSLDELLNQVELMKQVLEYYADTKNYHPKNSNVMLDGGHNARFVLKQIGKNKENLTNAIIKDLKSTLEEFENVEGSEEKIQKINDIINNAEKL